jgi:hypothetical protein
MLQSNETNWPQLSIPLNPVLTLSDRILLCYFCYRIGPDNDWVRIGRREIQTRFCRPGGRRVSKRVKDLYHHGILTRYERRASAKAYQYRLSPRFLSTPESKEWKKLSDVLFDERFPWRGLFDRPVVGHGFLNASGVLVLGAILSAEYGVSTGQLQMYFRGFVGEQTVRKAVRKLEDMAVVTRNTEHRLVPTADWEVRLDDYEDAVGAKKRAERLHQKIQFERALFNGDFE